MTVEVILKCYYRSVEDQCKNEGPCPHANSWCAPYRTNNYPPGTFVVMLPTPFPGTFTATPDLVYGPGNPYMATQITGGAPGQVFLVR